MDSFLNQKISTENSEAEIKLLKQKPVFDPRVMDESSNSQVLWTSESVVLADRGIAEGYKLRENPYLKTVRGAKLRKAYLPFKYTDDELLVLGECMQDKIFFANNFGKLKDANKGWVNITLRDYQETLIDIYSNNRWNLILFPRQSGKTTTTIIEICHFLIFNTEKDVVVIAQSNKVVNETLAKIKEFFAGLPFFLQPGFISFNSKGLILENGCRLSIGVASESVTQGFSLDLVYIDECAYIKSNMWSKFWNNIYPTMVNNPESRCIITSTPNGRNHFYDLWQAAILKQNRFTTFRIYWQDVPGRDNQFRLDTIANIGLTGWLMGFECSFDTQLKSVFNSNIQQILREYQKQNENSWSKDNHQIGNIYDIEFIDKQKIFYDLKKDFFLLCIDIAEGLEQDYSVLKIKKIDWNITLKRLEYNTIGIFRDNTISVDDFAEYTLSLTTKNFNTNNIKIVVENNNYGGEYFTTIKNLRLFNDEYKFVDMQMFAKFYRQSKQDFEYGIRWNDKNKSLGVKSFVTLTSREIFKESHNITIEEYLNFGKTQNNTYKASYGHDDTVMPDVSAAYFIKTKNVYSKEFLDLVESTLRVIYDDEPEDIKKAREDAIKKEQNRFKWNGFELRDSDEHFEKFTTEIDIIKDGVLFIVE
jgi:hypothetical protein